jgi:hypothetical protein
MDADRCPQCGDRPGPRLDGALCPNCAAERRVALAYRAPEGGAAAREWGRQHDWMLDTRWVAYGEISVAAFQEWSRAGYPGTIPAPLRCRLLARNLRAILGPDHPEPGERWPDVKPSRLPQEPVLDRIERETVCWVDLTFDIEHGRGVCRQAVIRPATRGGSIPRIPSVPLADFVRRYVGEGRRRAKVKPPPERRRLAGILPKVADAVRAHPNLAASTAVMESGLTDDREKAKRWVRTAKRDGLL